MWCVRLWWTIYCAGLLIFRIKDATNGDRQADEKWNRNGLWASRRTWSTIVYFDVSVVDEQIKCLFFRLHLLTACLPACSFGSIQKLEHTLIYDPMYRKNHLLCTDAVDQCKCAGFRANWSFPCFHLQTGRQTDNPLAQYAFPGSRTFLLCLLCIQALRFDVRNQNHFNIHRREFKNVN